MGTRPGADRARPWRLGQPRPAAARTDAQRHLGPLFLRAGARPDPSAPPATYRIELDDRVWTVRAAAGRVRVQPGEPAKQAASLHTDATTLNDLLANPALLNAAITGGRATAAGDLPALRRLLRSAAQPAAG